MVGQGSRSRDETGGTCATRLPAVELGPGAGRERLELPRCRQQLRYPHPPLPLSEHNARSLRGQGLGQQYRPPGPIGSQPYLIIVHITNRTTPQARQKDHARGLERHTAFLPHTATTALVWSEQKEGGPWRVINQT